jgi:gamma-glutamyltranspeptidase / glutathione hydrolase
MRARVSALPGTCVLQMFRVALAALPLLAGPAWGQPSPIAECAGAQPAPFCRAVRGDRAEGWPAQSRSEVMATNGMVVTSQPLAAQAGLAILRQGGNAVDAAVATAATLNVVEPMMVGVGGDLFVVVYVAKERKVYVLNASGTAPTGASLEHLNELGYHWNPQNWAPGSGMPPGGILAVTVPGTVWGWEEVQRRFGKLHFREVLEPAAHYAQDGFPVSERIAHDWVLPGALPLRGCCQDLDPESVRTWYVDGKPPRAGQIFRNPQLAHTLRLLQAGGREVFYRGEIAKAIVARSDALGGTMTLADLAGYHGEWVEPATSVHKGYDIYELPPPSQAWAAEEILQILDTCLPAWAPGATLAGLGPASPQYWHLLIEAKKLAYADLYAYNADPRFANVPLRQLLSSAHAQTLCGRVDPRHASSTGPAGTTDLSGDTVVLSTADSEGNMVSWVNSNYSEFGSGITVPGYGFVLHNRGALFTLDPHSPNVIAPGKRPFNTLAAGFVMHGSTPQMTVTLMGGDMQAQGHAQVLLDILDLGANVQAAADMARFRHNQVRNTVDLESALFHLVGAELSGMGHTVRAVDGEGVGGVQMILFTPEETSAQAGSTPTLRGFYRAGSDPRKDGQATGW